MKSKDEFIKTLDPEVQQIYLEALDIFNCTEDTLSANFQLACSVLTAFDIYYNDEVINEKLLAKT